MHAGGDDRSPLAGLSGFLLVSVNVVKYETFYRIITQLFMSSCTISSHALFMVSAVGIVVIIVVTKIMKTTVNTGEW